MLGFKRRRNIDPRATLAHLIPVGINAALDGSDEAKQKAANHMVADLDGLTRPALIRVAALCILAEGDAKASQIKGFAQSMMADLQAHLDAEGPETAAERPAEPQEAPEDLEPENGDESPAQGWAEDRR